MAGLYLTCHCHFRRALLIMEENGCPDSIYRAECGREFTSITYNNVQLETMLSTAASRQELFSPGRGAASFLTSLISSFAPDDSCSLS